MKDLNNFLNEKKDTSKPHLTKENEGADDKKYLALMGEYKKLRRASDRTEANKVLKQAQKLVNSGNVSSNARLAATYI